MAETKTCPKCGAQLAENAPAGICPTCLMQAGLASEPDAGSNPEMKPTTLTSGFVPPEPEELAKYFPQLEIIELLGKGGMGAVYKARQPGLDRLVAVKILPPEIGHDPAFAERFTREARALARLTHNHIVSVYDFGHADGLFFIIMEYVDGVNLRHAIQSGGLLPADALAIVPQICEALQFAHDEGIVHRDIKPENVLIDKKGRVKIADFGLAKLLGQDAGDHSLTATHQVMGTLRYMAPEQMQGSREVDHRADIYSLGVVFYELLTGELPMGKFAPPSKKVQVDVRLDEIVLRALEQEPEQRYQHASEVKTAVEVVSGSLTAKDVAAPESRETDEAITGWAVLRQSFLVLLSIAGALTLFMPWTWLTFGQTFPDGGGSFVGLAVHGWYHWFPIVGSLLAAALLFATLSTIGRSKRPLRAILSVATGLALTSVSLFTIAAKPLTVHPTSYSVMIDEIDKSSAHVTGGPARAPVPALQTSRVIKVPITVRQFDARVPAVQTSRGASALAELVRLSQTTDRWTPGKRHVTIKAEPFVGSWTALGTGLLLLVLGAFEFTSVVSSSMHGMATAPLQTAAAPARALRLTGMLGPAALLIVLLMVFADLYINGGQAPSQPWSLLRTLLIWSFFVHLFQTCFITPWILFGANRLRTLSSPGTVRAASILAMVPLNFSAFVGIPAGLWALFVLRGRTRSSVEGVDNPAADVSGPAFGLLLTGVLGCVLFVSMATFVLWRTIVGPFTGEPGLPIIVGLMVGAMYALMIFAATRMRQLADYQLVLFFTLLAILIPPVNVVGLPIGIWALAVLSRSGVRKAFGQNANGGHHHSITSEDETGTDPVSLPRRQLRGPAIALMLYGLILLFPAALCFTNGFDIADGNDATPAVTGFAMMALSFLLLGLAGLLLRGGWHMLALESYRAALLASFLGQPIGLWGLFVLSRPDVKSAFPIVSELRSEPRVSRFAISGAALALFVLLAVVPTMFFIALGRFGNGMALPTDVILGVLLTIGAGAPIGTTIFGALCIGHIKRSGGKIIGLPLAIADVLFLPLLILGFAAAAMTHIAQIVVWTKTHTGYVYQPGLLTDIIAPNPSNRPDLMFLILDMLVAFVVCFFAGLAAWRKIAVEK